jgi:tRNA-guanine family transglycosylase
MLAGTLLSIHNLRFFHSLLGSMREAIQEGSFAALRERVLPAMNRRVRPEDLD